MFVGWSFGCRRCSFVLSAIDDDVAGGWCRIVVVEWRSMVSRGIPSVLALELEGRVMLDLKKNNILFLFVCII